MNLKEAFRYQNKLSSLISCGKGILQDTDNTTVTTTTLMRHKAYAEAEDITIASNTADFEYAGKANQVAAMLLLLLGEREKLSAAITQAKATVPLDAGLDGEVSLNALRQELAQTFRGMAGIRSTEVVHRNGGIAYRFNAEGNQVTYRCDQKQVTTIDFDRNRIARYARTLSRKADEVSASLDAALINTPVTYEPPFDVNEEFREILDRWTEEGRLA